MSAPGVGRGTREAASSVTLQVSEDPMSFLESRAGASQTKAKQARGRGKQEIQERRPSRIMVVLIRTCTLGGGGGSGEKGPDQLRN